MTTLSTGACCATACVPASCFLPLTRCTHGRAARRHVILPKHVSKNAPKGRLLSESEWRGLGVQQSRGWVHYAVHRYVAVGRCC